MLDLSHLSESNQRPTDYKSVALPAELKWQILKNFAFQKHSDFECFIVHQRTTPFFGMAKVSENFIPQNFEKKIFAIFSTPVGNLNLLF